MNSSDLAADCLGLDGAEAVSVVLRGPDGSMTVAVAGALRRVLSRRAQAFDGVTLTGDELVWHLPAGAFAAGQSPRPGDTIETQDEVWSIVAASHETFGTRWRCLCRRRP